MDILKKTELLFIYKHLIFTSFFLAETKEKGGVFLVKICGNVEDTMEIKG
jgi:hypothetical protein